MKSTAVNYGYSFIVAAALGLTCWSCQSSKAFLNARSQAIKQNNENEKTIREYGSNNVESRGTLRVYDPMVNREIVFASPKDSSQYVYNHTLANAIVAKATAEAQNEVQKVSKDYSKSKRDEMLHYRSAINNSSNSPSFETYISHQNNMETIESNQNMLSKWAYNNYHNQLKKAEETAKIIRQKALNAPGVYPTVYHARGRNVQ